MKKSKLIGMVATVFAIVVMTSAIVLSGCTTAAESDTPQAQTSTGSESSSDSSGTETTTGGETSHGEDTGTTPEYSGSGSGTGTGSSGSSESGAGDEQETGSGGGASESGGSETGNGTSTEDSGSEHGSATGSGTTGSLFADTPDGTYFMTEITIENNNGDKVTIAPLAKKINGEVLLEDTLGQALRQIRDCSVKNLLGWVLYKGEQVDTNADIILYIIATQEHIPRMLYAGYRKIDGTTYTLEMIDQDYSSVLFTYTLPDESQWQIVEIENGKLK